MQFWVLFYETMLFYCKFPSPVSYFNGSCLILSFVERIVLVGLLSTSTSSSR